MTDLTSDKGKKGLIVGIGNEHGLADGCARHFRADLAVTYLNAKSPRLIEIGLRYASNAVCKGRSRG
jgi:enoyl-[acyl-carrier-protein] reductase (NADH)